MNQTEAEKQIALILSQLESEQDLLVDSVSINDVEVTRFDDNRRQHQRTVCIETHRLPGHNWGQAE